MPTESSTVLTSIVVPYFQREHGILRKCVNSVLAQQDASAFSLIVVDDASPVPATQELDGIYQNDPRVHIIEQKNAGPGAARNRGLDNLPRGTKYVAFIDSDDWWEHDFLALATSALDNGNDIFFANSRRHGFEKARFDWHATSNLQLTPADHQRFDATRELYTYTGSFFDYALVRSNIISTSALAYRLSRFPHLRFNTALFNGQDRLFKLHLSKKTNRVSFCPRILVNEGTGVNIYDSAKWGNTKSLRLLSNYIRLSKFVLAELDLTEAQRQIIIHQLDDSRFSMTASIAHLLKNRQHPDWRLVFKTGKMDPAFALKFVPNLARLVVEKLVSRSAPSQ